MALDDIYEMFDSSKDSESWSPSCLYNIEPMGLGTPLVEAFVCYTFQRLPMAHSLLPNDIYRKIYLPRLNEKQENGGTKWPVQTPWKNLYSLNGAGEPTQLWVSTINNLTSRSDLINLTLLPISEMVSRSEAFRQSQVWCPFCLETWRQEGSPIYLPLLWNLKIIHVCPLHHCYLQSRCTYCGGAITVGKSLPGFCVCNRWLGQKPVTSSEVPERMEDALLNEIALAKQIGDVLSAIPRLANVSIYDNFIEGLNELLRTHGQGNLTRAGKLMKVNQSTIGRWIRGEYIPNLEILCRLANVLNISLLDLLIGNRQVAKTQVAPIAPVSRQLRPIDDLSSEFATLLKIKPPISLHAISVLLKSSIPTLTREFPNYCQVAIEQYQAYLDQNRQKIQEFLEDMLQISPPPYLDDISVSLGLSPNYLRRYFPILAVQIIELTKKYRTDQAQRRKLHIREVIRGVVLETHNESRFPSRGQINKRLAKSKYSLREQCARDAYREIMQELGYKRE